MNELMLMCHMAYGNMVCAMWYVVCDADAGADNHCRVSWAIVVFVVLAVLSSSGSGLRSPPDLQPILHLICL